MNTCEHIISSISSTCIHMCGTEKSVCVKLQFYLRICQLLCKWIDSSLAGCILGPEAHSFRHHLNLFLSMSLDDTVDVCLAACSTPVFHCPIDLWGFVRSFFLSFPSLSLVSPRGEGGGKPNVGTLIPVPQGLAPCGCEGRVWLPESI